MGARPMVCNDFRILLISISSSVLGGVTTAEGKIFFEQEHKVSKKLNNIRYIFIKK